MFHGQIIFPSFFTDVAQCGDLNLHAMDGVRSEMASKIGIKECVYFSKAILFNNMDIS